MNDTVLSPAINSINSTVNIAGIVLAILPVGTLFVTDHLGMVSWLSTVTFFLLCCAILTIPDKISIRSGASWWENNVVWSIILIVISVLLGPTLYKIHSYAPLAILSSLIIWYNRKINLPKITISYGHISLFLVIVLIYLYLYGRGYHHWFFTQATVNEAGVLDTYFHAALSQSIQERGQFSTGIDGDSYLHYHWLSHVVMGRIAATLGVNSFSFYHLFYPVLFVPLTIKILFQFSVRFSRQMLTRQNHALLFTIALAMFYALPIAPLQNIQPFVSESQTLALIIVIGHATLLHSFANLRTKSSGDWTACIGISFLFGLAVSFTKLSTGFVWIGALTPIFLLHTPVKKWIWAIPLFLTIPILMILFVVLTSRGGDVSLLVRMHNIVGQGGKLMFLAWVPILLLIYQPLNWLPQRLSIKEFKKSINPATAPYLVISLIWLLGCIGALPASSWAADVTYFILPSVLLSFPIWIDLVDSILAQYMTQSINLIIGSILLAIVLTNPKLGGAFSLAYNDLSADQSENTLLRKQLLSELNTLRIEEEMVGAYITIPATENWFWQSGTHELANSFLIPAISGYPMIAGIPESIQQSNYQYYSVASYKAPNSPLSSPSELLSKVKQQDSQGVLVIYKAVGDHIVRQVLR